MTGTRRSCSHGAAMLAVITIITQICHASPTCNISSQNRPTAVQPPKRWVFSNTLCARARTGGNAHSTISIVSAASA